ncbi:MAG: hypothetical protein K9N40_12980, partial [Candidatus Cloacimonetes bacterium]|nr:hypothetical protein [Candidatus Cloacimonadota bacterium]
MKNFLNSNYSRETWINFLQNQFLPSDFSLRREQIDIDFQSKYIKPQAYWIGDCESLGDLAIIEVKHESEFDPRIGVSRDAFRLMAEHQLSKALFFFVSENSNNYRFSLITLDLKLEGKDVKYRFSNPKRFSFFLGEEAKIHTPQEFLFEKGRIKDFDDLQGRFSIEVVNKEFYHGIQRLFYKLVGGKVKQGSKKFDFTPMLKLPSTNDHQTMQEFSVRLVGRLVFCWFLKKKKSDAGIPLIPENILSSDAIERDYYHKAIEPLFFELLNTPIDERRDDFRSSEFDLIPFLNGGLFDPNLHEDYYRYSPMEKEYKPSYNLVIPDEWLEEFITLLETYNFTIDENTSIDIDLSVDPEMLGRIFENLLAEINPETGNTARKATGSYYTPRPIVEYMVDESLILYLLTKLSPKFPEQSKNLASHCEESSSNELPKQSQLEKQIRELLDYNIEGTELIKEQKIAVIDALDAIKVLDPACGSGAFPMGILQKMLLILQKVDPESIEWVIRQLDKIPNKLVRQTLEDKLMNENWKYKHKMGIIQNAIYGVDIQPIATEISKLRLFLTLIVDENIIDEKANRNIHPLPNLSFKFVTANTLIGLGKTPDLDDWMIKHAYEECVTDMEQVREQYFYEFDKSKKAQLENKIKDIQKKLYNIIIEHQIHSDYFNKLISWNPFEDKASGWFDPSWMFGISDGFDVIIANPPYGVNIPSTQKEYIKRQLIDTKNSNSASYFIDYSKNKYLAEDGTLTLIVPKSLLYSGRWFSLVLALLTRTSSLLDVEKGFEDVLLEQVSFTFSSMKSKTYKSLKYNGNTIDQVNIIDKSIVRQLKAWICDVNKFELSIVNNKFKNVIEMSQISKTTRGLTFQKHLKSTGDIKAIGGKNIQKYYINNFKGFLDKELIDSNKKARSLMCPKIISQRLVAHIQNPYPHMKITSTVDKNGSIFGVDTVENTIITNRKFSNNFILSLLNSKLLSWYLYKFIFCSAIRTTDLDNAYIGKLPIKDSENKCLFEELIDKIIDEKKGGRITQYLEDQLDLMVYKLYELTYEEAKIVDPELDSVLSQFGLSKEDYEHMSVEELAKLNMSDEELEKLQTEIDCSFDNESQKELETNRKHVRNIE